MADMRNGSDWLWVKLCCGIFDWFYLWEFGYLAWERVVSLPCKKRWELEDFWLCVCVAPLQLGGVMEKKNTPNIGWEVPMKSQILQAGKKIIAKVLDQSSTWTFYILDYGNFFIYQNKVQLRHEFWGPIVEVFWIDDETLNITWLTYISLQY